MRLGAACLLLLSLLPGVAAAIGGGVNWRGHVYTLVDFGTAVPFTTAVVNATAQIGCYPATITSAEETTALLSYLNTTSGMIYTGSSMGYDPAGTYLRWAYGENSGAIIPTGDVMIAAYQNWASTPASSATTRLQLDSSGHWVGATGDARYILVECGTCLITAANCTAASPFAVFNASTCSCFCPYPLVGDTCSSRVQPSSVMPYPPLNTTSWRGHEYTLMDFIGIAFTRARDWPSLWNWAGLGGRLSYLATVTHPDEQAALVELFDETPGVRLGAQGTPYVVRMGMSINYTTGEAVWNEPWGDSPGPRPYLYRLTRYNEWGPNAPSTNFGAIMINQTGFGGGYGQWASQNDEYTQWAVIETGGCNVDANLCGVGTIEFNAVTCQCECFFPYWGDTCDVVSRAFVASSSFRGKNYTLVRGHRGNTVDQNDVWNNWHEVARAPFNQTFRLALPTEPAVQNHIWALNSLAAPQPSDYTLLGIHKLQPEDGGEYGFWNGDPIAASQVEALCLYYNWNPPPNGLSSNTYGTMAPNGVWYPMSNFTSQSPRYFLVETGSCQATLTCQHGGSLRPSGCSCACLVPWIGDDCSVLNPTTHHYVELPNQGGYLSMASPLNVGIFASDVRTVLERQQLAGQLALARLNTAAKLLTSQQIVAASCLADNTRTALLTGGTFSAARGTWLWGDLSSELTIPSTYPELAEGFTWWSSVSPNVGATDGAALRLLDSFCSDRWDIQPPALASWVLIESGTLCNYAMVCQHGSVFAANNCTCVGCPWPYGGEDCGDYIPYYQARYEDTPFNRNYTLMFYGFRDFFPPMALDRAQNGTFHGSGHMATITSDREMYNIDQLIARAGKLTSATGTNNYLLLGAGGTVVRGGPQDGMQLKQYHNINHPEILGGFMGTWYSINPNAPYYTWYGGSDSCQIGGFIYEEEAAGCHVINPGPGVCTWDNVTCSCSSCVNPWMWGDTCQDARSRALAGLERDGRYYEVRDVITVGAGSPATLMSSNVAQLAANATRRVLDLDAPFDPQRGFLATVTRPSKQQALFDLSLKFDQTYSFYSAKWISGAAALSAPTTNDWTYTISLDVNSPNSGAPLNASFLFMNAAAVSSFVPDPATPLAACLIIDGIDVALHTCGSGGPPLIILEWSSCQLNVTYCVSVGAATFNPVTCACVDCRDPFGGDGCDELPLYRIGQTTSFLARRYELVRMPWAWDPAVLVAPYLSLSTPTTNSSAGFLTTLTSAVEDARVQAMFNASTWALRQAPLGWNASRLHAWLGGDHDASQPWTWTADPNELSHVPGVFADYTRIYAGENVTSRECLAMAGNNGNWLAFDCASHMEFALIEYGECIPYGADGQLPNGHFSNETCAFVCNGGFSGETCANCTVTCGKNGFLLNDTCTCECSAVAQGFYCDACLDFYTYDPTGALDCTACPTGMIIPPELGRSVGSLVTDCVCLAGTWQGPDGASCIPCPAGANCATNGSATVIQGFWCDPVTRAVSVCSTDGPTAQVVCPGGVCGTCTEGYGGTACSLCAFNYYRKGGLCYPCPAGNDLIIAFAIIGLVILSVAVMLLARRLRRFLASVSIVLSYLQLLAIIGSFQFRWPSLAFNFLNAFSFTNLNIELLSPQCSLNIGWETMYVVQVLVPLLVILTFGLFTLCVRAHSKVVERNIGTLRVKYPRYFTDQKQRFPHNVAKRLVTPQNPTERSMFIRNMKNGVFTFLSFAYVTATKSTLNLFECRAENGHYVYAPFPSVLCYQAPWSNMIPVAAIFFVAYGICIPALFIYILVKHELYIKLGHASTVQKYAMLFGRYRTERTKWELVVMARKVVVVIFQIFVYNYPFGQAGGIAGLLVVTLILQAVFKPYRNAWLNRLEASMMSFCLAVTFFGMFFLVIPADNTAGQLALTIVIILVVAVSAVFIVRFVYGDIKDSYYQKESGGAMDSASTGGVSSPTNANALPPSSKPPPPPRPASRLSARDIELDAYNPAFDSKTPA